MAIAMKCDRCEKLFDHHSNPRGAVKMIKIINYYPDTDTSCTASSTEFCPECFSELASWLNKEG